MEDEDKLPKKITNSLFKNITNARFKILYLQLSSQIIDSDVQFIDLNVKMFFKSSKIIQIFGNLKKKV